MQQIRYLDKLVDELARGKAMDKILEVSRGFGVVIVVSEAFSMLVIATQIGRPLLSN